MGKFELIMLDFDSLIAGVEDVIDNTPHVKLASALDEIVNLLISLEDEVDELLEGYVD